MHYTEWVHMSLLEGDARGQRLLSWLSRQENMDARVIKFKGRHLSWLSGRLAAKKAAARCALEKYGMHIPLSMIEIESDQNGAPVLAGPFLQKIPKAKNWRISIAHSEPWAVAVLTDSPKVQLGVDIEKISPRENAWREIAFHPEENPYKSEDPAAQTQAWTVKEAVLKSLGLGLTVDLHEVRLQGDGVSLFGKTLERFNQMGLKEFKHRSWYRENYVATLAVAEESN